MLLDTLLRVMDYLVKGLFLSEQRGKAKHRKKPHLPANRKQPEQYEPCRVRAAKGVGDGAFDKLQMK